MRIKLNCLMLVAATMTLGAAESHGQMLTANVPFRFRIPGTEMPPGQYSVSALASNGVPVLILRNEDVHKSALVMARTTIATRVAKSPRMVFQCGGNRCSLAEIWGATSADGVEFARPRVTSDEAVRMAVVHFDQKQAGR